MKRAAARGLNWFQLLMVIGVFSYLFPPFAQATLLEDRLAREEKLKSDGLFILPYNLNYLMPLSYSARPNMDPYPPGTDPFGKYEAKFQFSVKIPLAEHLFSFPIQTNLAYTQVSYWQAYEKYESSVFRETDYQPELFLQAPSTWKIGGLNNRYNRFGYMHQSNGQDGTLSRSWNRIFWEFVFDTDRTFLSIKPWYRISGPPREDTNPDMAKYYGYGELRGAWKLKSQNEFSFMLRNNLWFSGNKGAIELGWSFPLIKAMKGFFQYFNGYGESLIDYNTPMNRISAGVSFSDWL